MNVYHARAAIISVGPGTAWSRAQAGAGAWARARAGARVGARVGAWARAGTGEE